MYERVSHEKPGNLSGNGTMRRYWRNYFYVGDRNILYNITLLRHVGMWQRNGLVCYVDNDLLLYLNIKDLS